MTALPLRDFTDAERAKLAAIEAAPEPPEITRERVARAMWDTDHALLRWAAMPRTKQAPYYAYADAALAVLSGPSSDAEQAVERALALDVWADPFGQWTAQQADAARQQKAEMERRIRAAVAGD